jgi:regulator of sigma E protease
MLGILLMVSILSVLIVGHELAHFWVARLFGLQTPVFGFGLPFGPYWTIAKIGDTQFRIHLLLFGAYISIPELDPEVGQEDDTTSPLPKPFSKFPLWQRVLVVLAGIGFYVVIAWMLLFGSIIVNGTPQNVVVVRALSQENLIATNAGIKAEDHVIAVDSQQVSNTNDVISYLRSHPSTSVVFHVQRQAQPLDISMTTDAGGRVGMSITTVSASTYQRVPLTDSFGLTTQRLCAMTAHIFGATDTVVSSMLRSRPTEGENQYKVLGVLATSQFMADLIAKDWRVLPSYVVWLSIDMALMNLIPWPGFDASHLLAILINAARGKPLPKAGFLHWIFVAWLTLTVVCCRIPLCLLRGKLGRSRQ